MHTDKHVHVYTRTTLKEHEEHEEHEAEPYIKVRIKTVRIAFSHAFSLLINYYSAS